MPEVDTVLTTSEVQRLLDERGVALHSLPEAPLDDLASGAPEHSRVYGYPGGAGAAAQDCDCACCSAKSEALCGDCGC